MPEIRFRSDIRVEANPDACCGSDEAMARAAWAVPPRDPDARDAVKDLKEQYGKDGSPDGVARVLGACLRLRHNSPFEHGLLSVYAELPGVCWWQLTRQRFMSLDAEDFSFSLESGRYKHLDPEFYLPPRERPFLERAGFSPMRPELSRGAEGDHEHLCSRLQKLFREAWAEYEFLSTDAGGGCVAREVARLALPNWALYCDGYVTAKPLSWLQFFSKRNRTADTAVPTFPQWETERFARGCEQLFALQFPATHAAFNDNGRVSP